MNKKHPLLTAVFCLFAVAVWGQARYNFGENHPQQDLPVSRAVFGKAASRTEVEPKPRMTKLSENEYALSGGWLLAEESVVTGSRKSVFDATLDTSHGWYEATVPGTVLTTLVDRGVYADPYWGLNNLTIPESLCRKAWWYRVGLDIPAAERGKRTFIRFEGINYKAEVWVNYHKAGEITGAFRRGEFDITPYLLDRDNVLAVKILPPKNPGIPQEQNALSHGDNGGALCLDGPTFISSEGWDWMPAMRDRNIGIWQDVVLAFRNDISIVDPQIVTDLPLPDTSYADLTVRVGLKNHSDQVATARVSLLIEGVVCELPVELAGGETRSVTLAPEKFPQLRLKNPRLWWPNGYGAAELYTARIAVADSRGCSDTKQFRFGVREFEYELSVSDKGSVRRIRFNPTAAYTAGKPVFDNLARVEAQPPFWVPALVEGAAEGIEVCEDVACAPFIRFRVNGRPVFCKGGNWGMDDAMKRVSRERIEPYVRLHKEQGFNMIRNWTAESTEAVFFDLCDEYGILVFNDLGLSTANFNLLPLDFDLFLDNARDIVTRFRNHPSIAVWCPQNEGFPPAYIERGLSAMIASVDGTRHYIGNSRTLNTIKSGPWQYCPPENYFKMAQGFASEVGSPSLPTAESVRRMMAPQDTWPIGDVWYYHDWLMGKWGSTPLIQSYDEGINAQFGRSENLDEFCKKAQLINYESYRAIFEGWNSRLFDSATGVLLWMSHPAWPSMVWQTYSWDYETPGAYFGAKKGCEPLHIQYNPVAKSVEVVNASLRDYEGLTAEAGVYDLQGRKLWSETSRTASRSNTAVRLGAVECPEALPEVYFIRLMLRDARGKELSRNFYWLSSSDARDFSPLNELPAVRLSGKATLRRAGSGIEGSVVVANRNRAVALAVKLNLRDAATGEAVLPAYFSDGYFTLLPGESRTLTFSVPKVGAVDKLCITAEGHNAERHTIATIR